MGRFWRFVGQNVDVIAFAAALGSVGPLMAWWSVLVRRNVLAMDQLTRAHLDLIIPDPVRHAEAVAAVAQHTARQLFMIQGESITAGLLLVVLAGVLFAVARTRRNANRRMQAMFQLTSHQLKTPIAGVRALLQSLRLGSIPLDAQGQFLDQGVRECDRLEHMVETLLAYQRTVSRRSSKPERVASEELVASILAHRAQTFPTEEIQWSVHTAQHVWCDPDAVRVVLENLLDNARKYGGGPVVLAESIAANRWRLEVTDQGQGFDPGEAERLFEPFERGGGKGVAHGSGLGLYISRQLARQMRGTLRARSEGPGQGSTFVLELPLATSTAPSPEVAHG